MGFNKSFVKNTVKNSPQSLNVDLVILLDVYVSIIM